MKRKSVLIGFAVCLISLLVVTVFAHPGRTDSSGGHTNHSTGEYHYHHGYSAHDHYDMDGDGDLDCPYDFHDKTDHSSGVNRSSPNSSSVNSSSSGFDIDISTLPTVNFDDLTLPTYPKVETSSTRKTPTRENESSSYNTISSVAIPVFVVAFWLLPAFIKRK